MGLARPDRPMAGLDPEFAFRRNDLTSGAHGRWARPCTARFGTGCPHRGPEPPRSLGGTRCPGCGPTAHRHRSQASRDLPPTVGLPRPGPRRQVRADLHRLQEQPHRTPARDQRRHRRPDRRTQTACAGTFPAPRAGRPCAAAEGTPQPGGTQPISDDTLASAHRRWVDELPPLRRPDGTEFDKSAVFLYAYRHSYAQRHADAGTPVDVLRELMGHRSIATTQGYYSVTATRMRRAVDSLAAVQFNGRGEHVWSQARVLLESEHQRLAVGQVAVPFGICTEPSNVQAGGGACPFRFRCLGCGHFRSDPSYLPELRDYLDTLLRDRERIRAATELDDWARAQAMPSDAEIKRLRELIRRVEHDLDALDENDRRQIEEAVRVVRGTRQTVHLGLPTTRSPALDPNLEGSGDDTEPHNRHAPTSLHQRSRPRQTGPSSGQTVILPRLVSCRTRAPSTRCRRTSVPAPSCRRGG